MMRGYSAQEMVIQFGYVTMFAASFAPYNRDYAAKGWLGMRHVSISIRASVAPHRITHADDDTA